MLLLTRVVREFVILGGEYPVLLCLAKAAGERATLGICAHEEIPIYRLEIVSDIIAANLLVKGISAEERETLDRMELLLMDPMANHKAINILLRSPVMVDLLYGDYVDNI